MRSICSREPKRSRRKKSSCSKQRSTMPLSTRWPAPGCRWSMPHSIPGLRPSDRVRDSDVQSTQKHRLAAPCLAGVTCARRERQIALLPRLLPRGPVTGCEGDTFQAACREFEPRLPLHHPDRPSFAHGIARRGRPAPATGHRARGADPPLRSSRSARPPCRRPTAPAPRRRIPRPRPRSGGGRGLRRGANAGDVRRDRAGPCRHGRSRARLRSGEPPRRRCGHRRQRLGGRRDLAVPLEPDPPRSRAGDDRARAAAGNRRVGAMVRRQPGERAMPLLRSSRRPIS